MLGLGGSACTSPWILLKCAKFSSRMNLSSQAPGRVLSKAKCHLASLYLDLYLTAGRVHWVIMCTHSAAADLCRRPC